MADTPGLTTSIELGDDFGHLEALTGMGTRERQVIAIGFSPPWLTFRFTQKPVGRTGAELGGLGVPREHQEITAALCAL